ncbi:hypothetical protein ARAM_001061 [Aspergillus rambellii]|uniref:Ion transport domain-containing protein n=1 Tax=Aspergillus rambellii TaxID=308745 RepID=A0A0F8VPU7_9EURO|nr:hypothetical protein ARAM_001061 [Aspergillus rambellii]
MLASLLRPKKLRREYAQRSQFSPPYSARKSLWLSLNGKAGVDRRAGYETLDQHETDEEDVDVDEEEEDDDDDADGEDDDGPIEATPLLPIFSAPHLDILPVYDVTHAIRSLIISRCETTLTWDQLRSPQISQFLVKPIQQKITALHFSRATLYALMTNCLQFNREVHLNPGNSGTNQTRAMVSELLAIKLLREYTTRELIDALSYDFYPLQGQTPTENGAPERVPGWNYAAQSKRLRGVARISCLEIAIRAQAKRFLSHPLVVKQLEAIWAGTVVFHSAADSLHRPLVQPHSNPRPSYGAAAANRSPSMVSDKKTWPEMSGFRRSVTLYDPRDASLFKLSRLRVPRYRQFLSTLSFAVLLGLFLAVLHQRSMEITPLEIVFWFWSAGFMLDEIVGFNEQGFSLYLMSFWNLFDLGILFLLFCYYCMRLYGALMPYAYKETIAERAYDILAANAVLLFPRLFSVLDHYRYFSQLLIAFRIMASDLVAVFLLIIIACSGFFVAFTSSFSNNQDQSPSSVAYALFQMLMGFTPAAWTLWDEYNVLGRAILTIFLFICHFVVVTILITVLTNSFMGIVQNANQEHQFLFAVNTISMVKSDALFSYVAPTNILAWLITPLRYLIPFKQYVKVNRTIIKITHLPILFTICLYEKTILGSQMIESTDLIDSPIRSEVGGENRGAHHRFRALSSRAPRFVREPSVATYQKDRALEEVFRRPFHGDTNRGPVRNIASRKSNNIVDNWMEAMESGPVNAPDEQDSDEVYRLERLPRSRFPFRARRARSLRNFPEFNLSAITSNHEDRTRHATSSPVTPRDRRGFVTPTIRRKLSRHTDIEGDNELTSGDNEDGAEQQESAGDGDSGVPATTTPGKSTPKFYSSRPSTARRKSRKNSPTRRPHYHSRNPSGATILYNPILSPSHDEDTDVTSSSAGPMPVPGIGDTLGPGSWHHATSILDGLGSDLGDNKAIANGFTGDVPSSFTTQMAYATGGIRRGRSPQGSQDILSKLVLARMNNIEEGFREVIKEVKDLRRTGSSRNESQVDEQRSGQREKRRTDKKDGKKNAPSSRRSKISSDGMRAGETTYDLHEQDIDQQNHA